MKSYKTEEASLRGRRNGNSYGSEADRPILDDDLSDKDALRLQIPLPDKGIAESRL